jgi:2'-5' RNA ligase
VLWVGLSGDLDRLAVLAREVERAVVDCGWPPENRPFHPHVTLARFNPSGRPRGRRAGEPVSRILEEHLSLIGEEEFPEIVVREIVLIESHLNPGGARYLSRDRFPLAGSEEKT